jgi:hypothetical protein
MGIRADPANTPKTIVDAQAKRLVRRRAEFWLFICPPAP